MHKLNYFYCLQHPTSNSIFSGCISFNCTTESLTQESFCELKVQLQESAQKASGNALKASSWSVTALNKI